MGENWLDNWEILRSTQPDHFQEKVADIMVSHGLTLIGQDARLDAVIRGRRLPDIGLYYISYGAEVRIDLYEPTDTYLAFQMPLKGKSKIQSNGKYVVSNRSVASVVSPRDDVGMHWSHDCSQLICQIGRGALEANLAGLLGTGVRKQLWFHPAMDMTARDGRRVRSAAQWLARRLNKGGPPGDDLLAKPRCVRHIEQQFMTKILFAHRNNYSDALLAEARPASSKQVEQAVALLHGHPERDYTIHDLAARVDIGVRSLQRGFLELGTTFRELRREIRLHRINNELFAADPGMVTVAEVMDDWGVSPSGHTTACYRRLFGESPGETLKRTW